MEDILEVIFALVAGFFWLFGGTLFKRREVDDEEPSTPASSRRRNQRQKESQSDRDARQREIRETILRKIKERRQQQQSHPEPVLVSEPEPQKELSDPTVYAESAESEAAEANFSWDAGNEYSQEMQKRLQEIEATKRQAEALKTQLRQTTENHFDTDSKRDNQQYGTLSAGSVRSTLKNAQNVRAAFVYGEILGKPVSLRNSSKSGLNVGYD